MFKFNLAGLTAEENTKLSNDKFTTKIKDCFVHNTEQVYDYDTSDIKSELKKIPYIQVAFNVADFSIGNDEQRTLSFIALPEKYLRTIFDCQIVLHHVPDIKSVKAWYKSKNLDMSQDELVPMCLGEYSYTSDPDDTEFDQFDCVLDQIDQLDDVITAIFNY